MNRRLHQFQQDLIADAAFISLRRKHNPKRKKNLLRLTHKLKNRPEVTYYLMLNKPPVKLWEEQ